MAIKTSGGELPGPGYHGNIVLRQDSSFGTTTQGTTQKCDTPQVRQWSGQVSWVRHHKSQTLTSVLRYSKHISPPPAQTPYGHSLQHKYHGDTSPWYGHKGMKQNGCYKVQECTAQSSWDTIPQYNYRALIPWSCLSIAITAWLTPSGRHHVGVHRGSRHLWV